MKNPGLLILWLQLVLVICVSSCDKEAYNEPAPVKTDRYVSHQPVSKALIGKYYSVPGSLNTGAVTITENSVFIDLVDYKNHIMYNQYQTISVIDCFFEIHLSNGTVIKISDFTYELGLIHLFIDGKLIATLEIEYIPTPEPEPETPILN